MDPQQQYPGSSQGNPYEFILNPNKPAKAKAFGPKNRLPVILGLIAGAVLLVVIVLSVILSAIAPKKIDTATLVGLAQTQQELIRISSQAATSAVQQSTLNLASTVEFTMTTQQQQTEDVLSKNGVKVDTKQLALKQNATTDQKFASAKSTSTFDEVYTEIIQTQLNSYASTLKGLTTISASQSERDRMSDYYRQTQLLISQIPYTQGNIQAAGGSGQ